MKKVRAIFILALFFALPLINLADGPPPPPGGGGGPGGGGTPVGAPIDGGLGILLALGLGYGAFKIYKLKKAQNTPEIEE
jgi:hypothetical protein